MLTHHPLFETQFVSSEKRLLFLAAVNKQLGACPKQFSHGEWAMTDRLAVRIFPVHNLPD